jgi:hypothetical protein
MNANIVNELRAAQTAIATGIDKMLRPDDGMLIGAAARRCEMLVKFFADTKAELIDEAISADFLAVNLIAMSPAKSEQWTKDSIDALSEAEKLANDGAAVKSIKAQAATMRSAYVRFSQFRKLYRAHNEHPAIWTEFCKMEADWNNRMSWIVGAIDDARSAAKMDAASAILVAASEVVKDGKVVPTLTTDEARAQVAKLNAAAKTIKDRAAQTPAAVAAECVKLIGKRNADPRAVLAALIETVYGANHEVVSADALKILRAKKQA